MQSGATGGQQSAVLAPVDRPSGGLRAGAGGRNYFARWHKNFARMEESMPEDSTKRLAARLPQLLSKPVRRPVKWAVEALAYRRPDEVAPTIVESLNYSIAHEHNWWETCELLARALQLDQE